MVHWHLETSMQHCEHHLETAKLQSFNTACEGSHSLLEGRIAEPDVPELILGGVLVYVSQILLHGLEAGCDASTVVRMRLL